MSTDKKGLIVKIFVTKPRSRRVKVHILEKPVTACLIQSGLAPFEEYQPELWEIELKGRFLSARKHPNYKAFYAFNPLELSLEFIQEDRGSECEASINFYDEALLEVILDRKAVTALNLDQTVKKGFENILLKDKTAIAFRQKNKIFQANLDKATYFIGHSHYFSQVFLFDNFKQLTLFNMVRDLIKPQGQGVFADFSNLRLVFCRLKSHLAEIIESVAAYRKLAGRVELSQYLDEKFLSKFAQISDAFNKHLVIPMLPFEASHRSDPSARVFHRLYSLLSVVAQVKYFEDLANEKMIKILKRQSEGLEDALFPLLDSLPWDAIHQILSHSISTGVLPLLFPVMQAQLQAKRENKLPGWESFAFEVLHNGKGLGAFFPKLHFEDHDEVLFDLLTLKKGKINQPVPARCRVDIKGVAAFISSKGDWWIDNKSGKLLDSYERVHAKVAKVVKYGPYVWSMVHFEGRILVQKYHLSDSGADSLEYIRDEVSETIIKGAVPDFGNKRFVYYVKDDKIYCVPNQAVIAAEDILTISLRKLLSHSQAGHKNAAVLDHVKQSGKWYYDAYYHLSKSRLLVRYVEHKTVEDGCQTIEDLTFCFKWLGDCDFEYRSRFAQLVTYDRYISKSHQKLAQLRFFSRGSKDYCLAYSTLTGELSLGVYAAFRHRVVLPWGLHWPSHFKYGNSPASSRIEWFKKKNKETNIFFCMDWDAHEDRLRVVACWLKGPNPHLVVPYVTQFTLRID